MDSLLYTTDGGRRKVTPSNGTDFSLEELQGFVGGYIEDYQTRRQQTCNSQ